MNSQWMEKAERLRTQLARSRADGLADDPADPESADALERLAIARWLRDEFSDEPPEDDATLALFPDASCDWPAGRDRPS